MRRARSDDGRSKAYNHPSLACQASKTAAAFRSRCARPGVVGLQPTVIASRAPHLLLEQSVARQALAGRYIRVSEAFCPNIHPRAHARLTGLTNRLPDVRVGARCLAAVARRCLRRSYCRNVRQWLQRAALPCAMRAWPVAAQFNIFDAPLALYL